MPWGTAGNPPDAVGAFPACAAPVAFGPCDLPGSQVAPVVPAEKNSFHHVPVTLQRACFSPWGSPRMPRQGQRRSRLGKLLTALPLPGPGRCPRPSQPPVSGGARLTHGAEKNDTDIAYEAQDLRRILRGYG